MDPAWAIVAIIGCGSHRDRLGDRVSVLGVGHGPAHVPLDDRGWQVHRIQRLAPKLLKTGRLLASLG